MSLWLVGELEAGAIAAPIGARSPCCPPAPARSTPPSLAPIRRPLSSQLQYTTAHTPIDRLLATSDPALIKTTIAPVVSAQR